MCDLALQAGNDVALLLLQSRSSSMLTFSGSSVFERAAFADVTKKSDTCCRHTKSVSTQIVVLIGHCTRHSTGCTGLLPVMAVLPCKNC